jgi:hypothetical protein
VLSTTEDLVDANDDYFDQLDFENGKTTSRGQRIDSVAYARLRHGGDANINHLPYGFEPRITIYAPTPAARRAADAMLRQVAREQRRNAA